MDRMLVRFGGAVVVALLLGWGVERIQAQQSYSSEVTQSLADPLSSFFSAGMLGQVEDMAPIYRGASFLVHPSR